MLRKPRVSNIQRLDPEPSRLARNLDGHFRFDVVLPVLCGGRDSEIQIRACRATWNGNHVVYVLAPFSVLPSGRRRAQVLWSDSLRESIRAAAEFAIVAYIRQRGGASESPCYGTTCPEFPGPERSQKSGGAS